MFYFRSIQMKHKVKQSLCNTKTGSNSCFSWSWSAFHVCLSEFSVWNKGKFVVYCYLLSLLVCWIQSLFSVCLEGLKESSERIYKLSAADQLLLLSLLHWNINWIFSAHSSVDFAVIWLEGGGSPDQVCHFLFPLCCVWLDVFGLFLFSVEVRCSFRFLLLVSKLHILLTFLHFKASTQPECCFSASSSSSSSSLLDFTSWNSAKKFFYIDLWWKTCFLWTNSVKCL